MAIILGTAGHIDHGKTTLVQALTGINCDKLSEEKRRGITIELGFAYCDLPTSGRLSIVDVPGHEKFVKNMVAGASGIDIVMLVIAADEGIMPQTKEHIEICSLLDIKHGLIVITKTDMVDHEWLELTKEDIKSFLCNTFLSQSPIFTVSSKTGEGIEQLKTYIDTQSQTLPVQNKTDLFRLPIDRVFSMKGYGTVVTGTITSGSISVGTELELLPSKKTTKVKNIQNHGQSIKNATAGQRTAINLHGLDVSEIKRGDILTLPKTLFLSSSWIISITCLHSSPKPIKNRMEIHFHHGTQEIYAQIYLLDRTMLYPGETSICEIRFKEPHAGIFNDHCIIRSFSPLRTIAGGRLVNPLGFQITSTKKTFYIEQLSSLTSLYGEKLVLKQIMLAKQGLSKAQLLTLTNTNNQELISILINLKKNKTIICFDEENEVYISFEQYKLLKIACTQALDTLHKKEPLKQGFSRNILSNTSQNWCKHLLVKLIHFIINELINEGIFVAVEENISLASHKISLGNEQQGLYDTILNIYVNAQNTPPSFNELEKHGINTNAAKSILKLLVDKKMLTKINDTLYYSTQVIEELKKTILEWFTTHNELDLASFKNLCGNISRKYTIPLLEFFDKERVTIRVGDKRQLRKNI